MTSPEKPRSITLPTFLVLVLLVSVSGLAQDRPALVDQMDWADTVLVNGKIVSMDDRSSVPNTPGNIYSAMAIKGSKIMALGSVDEIQELAGPQTLIVDLGNRTLIPGLIATHYHMFTSAARKYGPQFGLTDPSIKLNVLADTTPEATAKKIRDAVVNALQTQDIPKGKWVSVFVEQNPESPPGTVRSWLFMGKLNRRQLDAVTPDHPMMVSGGIGGYFNQPAIDEFKKEFEDWEESTNLETGPDSAMNGYFAVPEQGALTFEFWWKDKPLADLAEVMRLQGLDIIRNGITTVVFTFLIEKTTLE